MKITKTQLRQIIDEELAQTLNELEDDKFAKPAVDALGDASKKAVTKNVKTAVTKGARGVGGRALGGSLGALGAAASLADLANPEGFYAQAGDATKGLYQDLSKRTKEYFNPKKADKKKAIPMSMKKTSPKYTRGPAPMAEQIKQFIREELSEVMSPREYIAAQEATEKEMETYLIEKGVYKGDRNGRISIMTGIVGEASDVMDDAVAKGLFDEYAVMKFINRLHRMVS